MAKWMLLIYRFLARHWNSFLAAFSLLGVAIFSIWEPLQQYVSIFIFIAANAVVWTLIEIKNDLNVARSAPTTYANMRVARANILADVGRAIKGTSEEQPLRLSMLGGRIRSMSDIVREISDDLRSGRIRGHVSIDLYCLDPDYIRSRIVGDEAPGGAQATRNDSYGRIIESISKELNGLAKISHGASTLRLRIVHYRHDPYIYAFAIGDSVIYWGTYTWSSQELDFVGPENPCVRVGARDDAYDQVHPWLTSRLRLFEIENDEVRDSDVVGANT